jgi:hypothetical protein
MTTTQPKSLAELCAEAQTIYQHTEDSPHGSIAFAVTASGNIRTVAGSGDIYLSLSHAAFHLCPDDDYLGISVWGWAAPTSSGIPKHDDVPPSEHPERSRMHLVTIADKKGQSESRLHFIEQDDIKTTDGSTAVGALKDALENALRIAKAIECAALLQQLKVLMKPDDN